MRIVITFLFLYSSLLFASKPDVSQCGERPGLLGRMLTDADEIRKKCINDAYDAHQRKVLEEANALSDLSKKLEVELKKVAYDYKIYTIRCTPGPGDKKDAARTKKCNEINSARNAVINRMNVLMGWNSAPRPQRDKITEKDITPPPCPSRQDLEKLRSVRYFNKGAYQMWERCVNLGASNYY